MPEAKRRPGLMRRSGATARDQDQGDSVEGQPAAAVGSVFQPRTMNDRDDHASAQRGKVEIDSDVLALLEDEARQKGLSLFAYLGLFVSQDTQEPILKISEALHVEPRRA